MECLRQHLSHELLDGKFQRIRKVLVIFFRMTEVSEVNIKTIEVLTVSFDWMDIVNDFKIKTYLKIISKNIR